MFLPDVNVLIYAHRTDSCADHAAYAEWLTGLAIGHEPFALSSLALAGIVRIVTNPRIFRSPSTHDEIFGFIGELVAQPNARVVHPGPNHLEIFEDLCRRSGAKAKLVADAQHAAIAVEHGCTLVTTDSDFDRFPGLRWQHPLRRHG
jgi:toxin-antitoxin system PIN domain toxin